MKEKSEHPFTAEQFNFCLVIEPSYEDSTHVAVVNYDKPICYLHEWSKAWNFHFAICTKDSPNKDGIGRGAPHLCGRKSLSQRQYNGYVG